MISYGIVVHGGAGTPANLSDACKKACEGAFGLLGEGRSSLDAVAESVRILEDDGRFNAGYGSAVRLDGKTIEMDAALMDSRGRLGIVIAIRNVKNPILVARRVVDTPHVALAGEGATVFANKKGFDRLYSISPDALERYQKVKRMIKEKRLHEEVLHWKGHDVESLWNFQHISYQEIFCDTVGAAAIDRQGVFSSAASTGGFAPMMLGRVGDTPMIGCGFYAGLTCAVAVTGMGEEIVRKMVARQVYERVSNGESIERACKESVDMFPPNIKVGVIGISKEGYSVASNTHMASYVMVKESKVP
ncbi:MAG: isoaspartyl peptidase/L-asparaginase [Nitrospirota bacterium]